MRKLVPKPKFITFDCYGTLVQWHRALETSVRAILAEHLEATGADEAQVTDTVEALRTLSMESQQRPPYRDYKTILQSSLAEVMVRKKLSLRPGDGETLLSYLRAIPPHPEVPTVLQRLRAQFRLAIISNTDDDLIGQSLSEPVRQLAQWAGAHLATIHDNRLRYDTNR
jgi:2-haloacid dehalogenase